MRRRFARLLLLLSIVFGGLYIQGASSLVHAAPALNEYAVPGNVRPDNIVAGPDGNLWFTEENANAIGEMSTSGTLLNQYPLPVADSEPNDITVGPDGALWFTEGNNAQIGRITTEGTLTEFNLPSPYGSGGIYGITVGSDGALWFTMEGNRLGRITTSGDIALYYISNSDSQPLAITAGPDGDLWLTYDDADSIGQFDPSSVPTTQYEYPTPSVTVSQYPLPSGYGPAENITAGPDGNLWFTNQADQPADTMAGYVGMFSPTTDAFQEYLAFSNSYAQGITVGSDGNLWVTSSPQSEIAQVTTSGIVTTYSLPYNGNRDEWGITAGPDGNLWFTDSDTSEIGQYVIAPSSPPTAPTALVANSVTDTYPQLSWDPVTGATSYNVYQNGTLVGNTSNTTFTDGSVMASGSYTYAVTGVNSAGEGPASSPVTVLYDIGAPIVSNVNLAPSTIVPGGLSELSASVSEDLSGVRAVEYFIGSDPGQGHGTPMNVINGSVTTWIGSNLVPGNYTVSVRAESGAYVWSAPVTAQLNVQLPAPTGLTAPTPTNQDPVLTWNPVSGAASYNVYQNGSLVGNTTSTTFTDSSVITNGNYSYQVTAVSPAGVEGLVSTWVTVEYDTNSPTITYTTSPATANANGWFNSPVTVTFTCTDPTSGVTITACTSPVTLSNDGASQAVTGTATDAAGNTASVTATVNVDQTPPTLGTPSWSANPITAGQSASLVVPATDNVSGVVGGEYYIGSSDPGQGNGTPMSYDGTNLNASLGSNLAPGTYAVNVRAEDAAGNWSGVTTTNLVVNPAPVSPVFTSASSAIAGTGSPFNFTVTTTGSPAPALTYRGNLPSGLSFTDNGDGTATIGGSVIGSQGTYTLAITATNSGGGVTQDFLLYVNSVTITSASSDTESYGQPFNFTVSTTGNPAPALSKTGALPPGVTFTDNGNGTATIGGTPDGTADGPYTITIKAKNSAGSATQTFVLSVTKAPVIKNIGTKTTHVGTPYSLNVTSTGYATPSLSASGLPNGLSFTDNGNGTGTISGTPAVGSGGEYYVTVTATNSFGTATETFVMKVDEGPVITSASSATATVGSAFLFPVTATGYPAPSVTKSGTLPSGIHFKASTDTFYGTPAAGSAGTYTITITAKNSTGSVNQTFTLTVN